MAALPYHLQLTVNKSSCELLAIPKTNLEQLRCFTNTYYCIVTLAYRPHVPFCVDRVKNELERD